MKDKWNTLQSSSTTMKDEETRHFLILISCCSYTNPSEQFYNVKIPQLPPRLSSFGSFGTHQFPLEFPLISFNFPFCPLVFVRRVGFFLLVPRKFKSSFIKSCHHLKTCLKTSPLWGSWKICCTQIKVLSHKIQMLFLNVSLVGSAAKYWMFALSRTFDSRFQKSLPHIDIVPSKVSSKGQPCTLSWSAYS